MGTGTGAGTGIHAGRTASRWVGGSFFAGILMLVAGATEILQGVVAIRSDNILNGVSGYAYAFNLDAWGWIHVGLGILVAVVGLGILAGSRIARYAGIGLAMVNLVAQFMFLFYQPVWAVVGMALSAFIIWALTTDRVTSPQTR
ncbi:DUF7144 family membrane protein [Streptomyces liangshanensis]|uniref:DUF7144 family membrane protein n=1 Tax=Streptomyces liangshanensis TaxID=2717324 RepID=UPI0036DE6CD5